jgi:hypothetical protein
MQYTVVHSKDPYLLARLATDLQMEGIKHKFYHKFAHPFFDKCLVSWLQLMPHSMVFNFHPHDCFGDPIRHELTSRNYIKVLTQILS